MANGYQMPNMGGGGSPSDIIMSLVNAGSPYDPLGTNLAGSDISAYNRSVMQMQLTRQLAPMLAMQQLFGSLMGRGGGGNVGGWQQFFRPIRQELKRSYAPGEDRARSQLTNQITAQGGDPSSGQAQAAMGNLEGELAGQRAGGFGQAMMSVLGPWMNQRTSLMQALMGMAGNMGRSGGSSGGGGSGPYYSQSGMPSLQGAHKTGNLAGLY